MDSKITEYIDTLTRKQREYEHTHERTTQNRDQRKITVGTDELDETTRKKFMELIETYQGAIREGKGTKTPSMGKYPVNPKIRALAQESCTQAVINHIINTGQWELPIMIAKNTVEGEETTAIFVDSRGMEGKSITANAAGKLRNIAPRNNTDWKWASILDASPNHNNDNGRIRTALIGRIP